MTKLRISANFPHPNGTKEYNGLKVVGYTEAKWDINIDLGAPVIKPFGTYTLQYNSINKYNKRYDIDVDDIDDIIYHSKVIKQYANYRSGEFKNLKCFTNFYDQFGKQGGYNEVLRLLKVDRALKDAFFMS